jgi:hypothetical protein
MPVKPFDPAAQDVAAVLGLLIAWPSPSTPPARVVKERRLKVPFQVKALK